MAPKLQSFYCVPQLHLLRESLLAAKLGKAGPFLITDSGLLSAWTGEGSKLIITLTTLKGYEDEN